MTQAIINKNALYRAIPAMDALLLIPQVIGLSRQYGKAWVKSLLADMQSRARSDISEAGSLPAWCNDESLTVDTLKSAIRRESRHSLTPVINLTGTVLHTNLGRARCAKRPLMRSAMSCETLPRWNSIWVPVNAATATAGSQSLSMS